MQSRDRRTAIAAAGLSVMSGLGSHIAMGQQASEPMLEEVVVTAHQFPRWAQFQ
jgi:hypothetical protein